MDVDTTDRKEQRKFGLVMAACFAGLGLIRWTLRGFATASMPSWLWTIAGIFLIMGLLWPRALGPVFRAWMALARFLNWLITRILLTILFYGMITPIRVAMACFTEDPLKRKWKDPETSYWEAPEAQPNSLDSYRNQF